jgi:hypothetical protein
VYTKIRHYDRIFVFNKDHTVHMAGRLRPPSNDRHTTNATIQTDITKIS